MVMSNGNHTSETSTVTRSDTRMNLDGQPVDLAFERVDVVVVRVKRGIDESRVCT